MEVHVVETGTVKTKTEEDSFKVKTTTEEETGTTVFIDVGKTFK